MTNIVTILRLIAELPITDPVGDWDNGYNEGVEKALEAAMEWLIKAGGDDSLERIANAAERAFPPHGWEYRRVGWLTEDSSPEGKSLEAINHTARPRWEVFAEPNVDHIGYLIRRPAPAPEETHDAEDLQDIPF